MESYLLQNAKVVRLHILLHTAMQVIHRIKRVEELKLCKNCLKGPNTGTHVCKVKYTCKICHKLHAITS